MNICCMLIIFLIFEPAQMIQKLSYGQTKKCIRNLMYKINYIHNCICLLYSSLQKDYQLRPNYTTMLEHPFCSQQRECSTDITDFVGEILDLPDSPWPYDWYQLLVDTVRTLTMRSVGWRTDWHWPTQRKFVSNYISMQFATVSTLFSM